MVRRGVVFEPTLAVHARPNDDAVGCVTPLMVALTRAAHEAGVALLAGTDFVAAAESEYPSLHQEIEILVSSGILTPLEAITAATRNPARALAIDATEGTIAAGKSVSLVVLGADPAADIKALRSVVTVFKRGREYPRRAIPAAGAGLGDSPGSTTGQVAWRVADHRATVADSGLYRAHALLNDVVHLARLAKVFQ